ncbi:MAG: carboxypeptidase regulatory-like domain-containing protein [Actinoplanes sp.]
MDADLAAFTGLPLSRTHRLLAFDKAVVEPRLKLRVSGSAPYPAMRIALAPLAYPQQPAFWGIEVVGTLSEPRPPGPTPYEVELDLPGPMGTAGIEVIGAGLTERIVLAAGDPVQPRIEVELRGLIKDASGWPLPGVLVRADSPAYEFAAAISARTDAEGRYTMGLVGPGRYRIVTEASGYLGSRAETVVREGSVARQDFYLTPIESIEDGG